MLRLVDKVQGHEGICWHASWDASGELLASCGQDQIMKIWRVIESKLVCLSSTSEEDTIHSRTIRRVAWRSDSKLIAACSFDSTITVWRVNDDWTLTYLTKIFGQESEVKGVCFSACGEMLATCSRDKSIWIFDVSGFLSSTLTNSVDVDCLAVLQGHSQDVKNVKFNPRNPSILISVSYDDSIKLWTDIGGDWELTDTLRSHTNTVWDISFGPKSNEFATVSADGTLKIWSSKPVFSRNHSYGPLSIASRALNAPTVVSSTWSCLTRQITTSQIANVPPAPVYAIDWDIDGLILLGCGDNTIRLLQVNKWEIVPVSTIKTHSEPTSVAFLPGNSSIQAVSFDDGSIAIYCIDGPL